MLRRTTIDKSAGVLLDLLEAAEVTARRDGANLPSAWSAVRNALFHATTRQGTTTLDDGDDLAHGDAMTPLALALDLDDTAKRLAVSRRSVERLIEKGELPAVRIAGRRRVLQDDIAAYLAGLPKECIG